MRRDDEVYVGHMVDLARKVQAKVAGLRREDFDRDENLRLALAHLLQTIGEAARRVSPAYQALHPEVPWAAIVGMRHKVVHDYLSVDDEIVWKTAIADAPLLVDVLAKLLPG